MKTARAFVIMLLCVFSAVVVFAQRKVTPVDTSDELKIVTQEELKKIKARAKAEQELADSLERDSLKLDSIENANKVVRPLLMSAAFGANIFDPLMRVFGQDYGGGELWAALNLKNRYIPVVELGFGMANSTPDEGNYTYKSKPAFYGKIGMNYNFMASKDPKYQFYLGVRAGWSAFKYDITGVTVNDGIWGHESMFDITGQSSHATWGEVVAGLQVGLFRNFSMGWSFRYNFLFNVKDNPSSRVWYIPGFGKRDGKINVSVSLIYNLPLSKTEEIKNVMEDCSRPIEVEPADTVRTATDTIPEREERVKEPEATAIPVFEE